MYMYVHGIFFEALEYLRIHSTMLLVWIRPSGRAPHSADANKDGFMLWWESLEPALPAIVDLGSLKE